MCVSSTGFHQLWNCSQRLCGVPGTAKLVLEKQAELPTWLGFINAGLRGLLSLSHSVQIVSEKEASSPDCHWSLTPQPEGNSNPRNLIGGGWGGSPPPHPARCGWEASDLPHLFPFSFFPLAWCHSGWGATPSPTRPFLSSPAQRGVRPVVHVSQARSSGRTRWSSGRTASTSSSTLGVPVH